MKYSDVRISLDKWDEIVQSINLHEGDNPACKLGRYWKDRMSPKMKKAIESDPHLPYGFVGDGWPQKADQTWALEHDKYGLKNAYDPEDWNCRDVGDAIYQGNITIDYLKDLKLSTPRDGLEIWDIGSGYGRLAIPLFFYSPQLEYYGWDFSPIGLLTAPQFVAQMTGISCFWWNLKIIEGDWKRGFFASCIPSLKCYSGSLKERFDMVISVHSFQEMEWDTVKWYIEFIQKATREESYFYSVNLDTIAESPEGVMWLALIPKSWELIFDRPYPTNRDGSFNERMWKIHG